MQGTMRRWMCATVWTILMLLVTMAISQGKIAHVDFPETSTLTSTSCPLTDRITAVVRTESFITTLNLQKNPDIHGSSPVYVIRQGEDGSMKIVRDAILDVKGSAEYQDKYKFASVEVKCKQTAAGNTYYQLNGELSLPDGKLYTIKVSTSRGDDVPPSSRDVYDLHLAHPTDNKGANDEDNDVISELKSQFLWKNERRRMKRQTEWVYIDVVCLIDHAVYERWYNRSTESNIVLRKSETKQRIRSHFAHIVNGVNLRFKETSERYNIRLIGYVIEDEQAGRWLTDVRDTEQDGWENGLNAHVLLKSAKNWTSSAEDFPRHDHVITWTTYDLYDERDTPGTSGLTGLSAVGTICKHPQESMSLVQYFDHIPTDTFTATHQVGHGLGAYHDGDNGNDCVEEDSYIMSTSANYSSKNIFRFSSCSTEYFSNYVNGLLSNQSTNVTACLLDAMSAVSVPEVSSQLPGQLYDPDTQCKMVYGQGSYFCRGVIDSSEEICQKLGCLDPEVGGCFILPAAEGTVCGDKKWCIMGECVSEVNQDCPFGDTPNVQGKTCPELIPSERRFRCYNEIYRSYCCETCLKYESQDPDCKYGDNSSSCSVDECREKNATDYVYQCCSTCRNYTTTTYPTSTATTSTPPTRVDGGLSDWAEWSRPDCGQWTCGRSREGRVFRNRSCTNPVPMFNGTVCTEPLTEYSRKSCGFNDCPSSLVAIVASLVAMLVLVIVIGVVIFRKKNSGEGNVPFQRQLSQMGVSKYMPEGSSQDQFPYSKLHFIGTLGEGNFGKVMKAWADGITKEGKWDVVAVKMCKDNATDATKQDFFHEIKIMRSLSKNPSPYIVNYRAYLDSDPNLLILEFAPLGNLLSLLRNCRSGWNSWSLSDVVVETPGDSQMNDTSSRETSNGHQSTSTGLISGDLTKFAYQIAEGMRHLHRNKIIHRDLAARNVLLGEGRQCKVSDFGMARNLSEDDSYETKSMNPLPIRWMAPESLRDRIYTMKSDVWSYGILLWEIVTLGASPYPGLSSGEVFQSVPNGKIMTKPDHCDDRFYKIMTDCWQSKVRDRPEFKDLSEILERLTEEACDYIRLSEYKESFPVLSATQRHMNERV